MRLGLILALALLAGCQGGGLWSRRPGLTSYVTEGRPLAAEGRLAEDLAGSLAGLYPPGHTRLYLQPSDPTADGGLDAALEQALRGRGFTLLPEPIAAPEVLTVAFVLDRLEEELWYTSLTLEDAEGARTVVSRTWAWNGQALEPRTAAKIERHGS